jgi:hypothetical protein
MGRAGIAVAILGFQVLEAILFMRGLKLPARFSPAIVALFVLFNLPLPYVLWLQAGARQPSFWVAGLVVRPFFAWQFSWFTFLLFFGPIIALAHLGTLISGYAPLVAGVRWLGLAAGGVWLAIAAAGLLQDLGPPGVERVRIELPGLRPQDQGLRVVQLSDTHLAWWNSRREMERIGAIVAGLAPDLLVVTGDMVDHNPAYVETFADALEGVQPRLGRYAIIGNHDVYTGRQEVVRRMRERGFVMLRGDRVSLRERGADITIAGFDDSGQGWTQYDPAARIIPALTAGVTGPLIVLAHRPPPLETLGDLPPMLILSGHTHGGQLRLPGGGPGLADLTFDYAMGLYRRGRQTLYVTRGTGTVGWPFRLFCPAEITLIELFGS